MFNVLVCVDCKMYILLNLRLFDAQLLVHIQVFADTLEIYATRVSPYDVIVNSCAQVEDHGGQLHRPASVTDD